MTSYTQIPEPQLCPLDFEAVILEPFKTSFAKALANDSVQQRTRSYRVGRTEPIVLNLKGDQHWVCVWLSLIGIITDSIQVTYVSAWGQWCTGMAIPDDDLYDVFVEVLWLRFLVLNSRENWVGRDPDMESIDVLRAVQVKLVRSNGYVRELVYASFKPSQIFTTQTSSPISLSHGHTPKEHHESYELLLQKCRQWYNVLHSYLFDSHPNLDVSFSKSKPLLYSSLTI